MASRFDPNQSYDVEKVVAKRERWEKVSIYILKY